jgi:hypothetical protein
MSNIFEIKKIREGVHLFQNRIKITKDTYQNISNEVKKRNYSNFYKDLEKDFGVDIKKIEEDIHNIALYGQVQIKGSKIMYLHGFVLYCALDKYIKDNKNINFFNILETGTARGFSSLCMAKALYDNQVNGKIYTIDSIIPNDKKIFWNCIGDFEYGMSTREQLFKKWSHLLPYIDFIFGDSKKILHTNFNNIDRFHFSFLDAQHDYDYLSHELKWVNKKQLKGDIIVCDDYTFFNKGGIQFPGINKAIDEFVKNKVNKIYYGEDGIKKRGYVVIIHP